MKVILTCDHLASISAADDATESQHIVGGVHDAAGHSCRSLSQHLHKLRVELRIARRAVEHQVMHSTDSVPKEMLTKKAEHPIAEIKLCCSQ